VRARTIVGAGLPAVAAVALTVSSAVAGGWDLPAPASAELCGRCHRAIEEGWKSSAHADAMTSRIFQDALDMAGDDFGAESKKVCLGCHAPMAGLRSDTTLSLKVTWEGVTCDYCHSLRSVDESGMNPKPTVEFSDVKSGPSKDVTSPAHRTAFSPLHTTSATCAICHEYKNAQGFPVVTTYSEWQESPAGKADVPCQNCHMFLVKGNVVEPRVTREAAHEVNLHEMPGSHSVTQLDKALRAKMTATRVGDVVRVSVTMTNQGAGHYFPTGSPMRKLILEVRAKPYGGDTLVQQKAYARTLADGDGKEVKYEHVAFLKAAKVLSDTRLAPEETKTETFTFPIPRGKQTRIQADLYYFHSPMASEDRLKRIKFLTLAQMVP